MKLNRAIRTIAPAAALMVVAVVLADTYQGIKKLPEAKMVSAVALTGMEKTVDSKALPGKLVSPRMVIYKSRHRLELYDGDTQLRVYQIALGREPMGDKIKEGDGATPEGTFFVCTKNAKSRYDRFLGLSYPNIEDGTRGLRAGLIDAAQFGEIKQAMEQGKRPPWNTKLGGQIGIHGGGVSRDWTQGCLAMMDDAVEELFDVIPYGTVVVIKP